LSDETKERLAAQMVAASEGLVSVPQAMKQVGFDTPSRKNRTITKRVLRQSKNFVIVDEKKVSRTSAASSGSMAASVLENPTTTRTNVLETASLSSLSNPPSNSSSATRLSASQADAAAVKRSLAIDDAEKNEKRRRRSSQQKNNADAVKAKMRKQESKAVKFATRQIAFTQTVSPSHVLYGRSQRKIVEDTNKVYNTNISHKTTSRMVRDGRIGESPQKPGPAGDFSKTVWNAMKLLFVSYLQLEQAHCKNQSTVKQLSLRVNAMVNAAGHKKIGNDLTRKLKKETADMFQVDIKNTQELRRLMWSTCSNLKAWFDTWQHTLTFLGFARMKRTDGSDDLVVGVIVFFDGQTNRILNIDETDGSLDNTNGQRGGRKPMAFYCHGISGGGTSASKSSYSPTIICGSTAAGEALPPHFQLKTDAKADGRIKISAAFIASAHNISGMFGHSEVKMHPCTFGLNEKAGMNKVELDKHFRANMLPLCPDIEDVPGKRVIAKVDSGPGRMHVPMLASMRLQGFYLVPGVPNTTGATQETDQNYGPFKTHYRGNLETLSRARFDMKEGLRIDDLPFLVFGGKDPIAGVELRNAFALAFSKENCLSAWNKCGAVPLTMEALKSPTLRHKVLINADGTVDDESDPDAKHLLQIEACNRVQAEFLLTLGYDSTHLRMDAPKVSAKKFKLTEPQSKERIEAIQKASSAGQLFHVTHGQHLNSEEFFAARAKTVRDKEAGELLKKKEERAKAATIELEARRIIDAKGQPTLERINNYSKNDLVALFKWRVKLPLKGTNKNQMLAAYLSAPEPESLEDWTKEMEDRLQELAANDIKFKDTALATALKQKMRAAKNNVGELDKDSAAELLQALQQRLNDDNDDGPPSGIT